jgi:S-adenosylmethionine hydrolase
MATLELPPPVRETGATRGEVVYVDHFGNLGTNVDAGALPARIDHVQIGDHRAIRFVAAYADGGRRELVAVLNSWGVVEIALRDGDARATLGVGIGAPVVVVGE